MFSSIQRRPMKLKCDAPGLRNRQGERSGRHAFSEDVRWRRQPLPKGEPANG